MFHRGERWTKCNILGSSTLKYTQRTNCICNAPTAYATHQRRLQRTNCVWRSSMQLSAVVKFELPFYMKSSICLPLLGMPFYRQSGICPAVCCLVLMRCFSSPTNYKSHTNHSYWIGINVAHMWYTYTTCYSQTCKSSIMLRIAPQHRWWYSIISRLSAIRSVMGKISKGTTLWSVMKGLSRPSVYYISTCDMWKTVQWNQLCTYVHSDQETKDIF